TRPAPTATTPSPPAERRCCAAIRNDRSSRPGRRTGTRLGDLGAQMPKTMIPVADRPFLEHLTGRLLRSGLHPVVVAVHHHADAILRHSAGHTFATDLRFVYTDQRGTGADLMRCLDAVPEAAFLVWNGDTVLEPNA